VYQSRDEANQQHQESQENRNQIEEDADRELLNMRIRHEQTVHEQQVKFHHVASMYISPVVIATNGTLLSPAPPSYGSKRFPPHMVTTLQKGTQPLTWGPNLNVYRVAQNKYPTRQYAISLQPVV